MGTHGAWSSLYPRPQGGRHSYGREEIGPPPLEWLSAVGAGRSAHSRWVAYYCGWRDSFPALLSPWPPWGRPRAERPILDLRNEPGRRPPIRTCRFWAEVVHLSSFGLPSARLVRPDLSNNNPGNIYASDRASGNIYSISPRNFLNCTLGLSTRVAQAPVSHVHSLLTNKGSLVPGHCHGEDRPDNTSHIIRQASVLFCHASIPKGSRSRTLILFLEFNFPCAADVVSAAISGISDSTGDVSALRDTVPELSDILYQTSAVSGYCWCRQTALIYSRYVCKTTVIQSMHC